MVYLERWMVSVSWLTTLFVTFMLVTDISIRSLFGTPLPAAYEISEVLMPYIVMFAFPYALTMNVHVRVSILTDRLNANLQFILEIIGNIFSLLTCILLTYSSWLRFWDSFIIREEILAPISIPWWLGKLGMPLAFGMFGFRFLLKLVDNMTHLNSKRG